MTRPLPSVVVASLVLAAAVSLFAANEARACSCLPPPPPATALERSAAVFVAEVLSVSSLGERGKEVSVRIERSYKGTSKSTSKGTSDTATLLTPSQSAACGRHFEVGKRYLVYAEEVDGVLRDHLCTRTMLLESAKVDLEALSAIAKGQQPAPEPEPSVEEGEGTPPSGAADGDSPALDEAPLPTPTSPEPNREQPGGHCGATEQATLVPLLALPLALLLARRRRRR